MNHILILTVSSEKVPSTCLMLTRLIYKEQGAASKAVFLENNCNANYTLAAMGVFIN